MRRIFIFCGICLVLLFLFLSNFGLFGGFGNAISGFFFGLFGSLWWILPLAGMAISFVALIKPDTRKNNLRLIASATLYLSLAWFVALCQAHWEAEIDFAEAFTLGFNSKQGGILALFIGACIAKFLSNAGAGILCGVIAIASLVFVIGIDNLLDLWDKYLEFRDSDERAERLERRREIRERDAQREEERYERENQEREARRQQREEKQRLRMDNVQTGVAFEGTSVKAPQADAPSPMQNLTEVNEEELRRRALLREEEEKRRKELGITSSASSSAASSVSVQTVTAGNIDGAGALPFSADSLTNMDSRVVNPSNYGVTNANNGIEYNSQGSLVYQTPDEKFIRQKRELERARKTQEGIGAQVQDIMGISSPETVPSSGLSIKAEDIKPVEPVRVETYSAPSGMEELSEAVSSRAENVMTNISSEAQNEEPDMPVTPETVEAPDTALSGASATSAASAAPTASATPAAPSAPATPKTRPYKFPPVELLEAPAKSEGSSSDAENRSICEKLEKTLNNFGVNAKVTNYTVGPTVTCFEIEPDAGVRVSKIVNLADDIKLNLAATDIRIEAPIPGKTAVGIEIPNKKKTPVTFREMIESKEFKTHKSKVAVAVGKDITGTPIIGDIAKMPHLLIAGTTGSGKSVCTSGLIMSILYHATPEEVRLIMIDPKVVEYTKFDGIPHLLMPVVTDPKRASAVLQGAVNEMTKRFQWFADAKVVDLDSYNEYRKSQGLPTLPRIVIFIDELADLMMAASKEVEDSICRIAQLARACGMHLVIATQRPSVNVVTGLIKANLPSRLALKVSNGVDSRTILDSIGAETLLGYGDMLYKPQDYQKAVRLQGCYIDADDQKKVVQWIIENNDKAAPDESFVKAADSAEESSVKIDGRASTTSSDDTAGDPLLAEAARIIIESGRGSVGYLQKKLKIGFNRGSRIMDELWEHGIVGPEEGTKPRRILVSIEEAERILAGEGSSSEE